MSKIKKQLLAGPYLIWIIGFIILPLFMIVYYAFKGSDEGFTFEYVAAIAQHTNIKALLLSLRLGIICTIICLVLSYPLAMILNGLKIKNQSFVVFVFMLPMWMNFMLRILAWKQLLSKNGVINSILTTLGLPGFNIMNTSGAVVLGMVYDFLPFMLLPIYMSMIQPQDNFRVFVCNNYDKAQGVAELAALAGMSLSVFKRRFAEHFNDSVYHWMMRQKALKIFTDIRDGEDSTKVLMNKYGFRHYTQFSRFCKNYLQATPAQLIASIKEG